MARPDQREIDVFLVLADISGYTDFMSFNRQEIAHAQHVISELIEALIDAAPEPLTVNKLEGDAVFLHAEASAEASRAVAKAALDFFKAFDDKRRSLAQGNACPCRACRNIRRLDLKVLAHFGRALVYRLKRFEELSGYDVILVHRLLKNGVAARRYLLASKPAWDEFAPPPDVAAKPSSESYDGIGKVETLVADIPVDPALFPDEEVPAKGAAWLKDVLVKHWAEFQFPLRLKKAPRWGDVRAD